VRLIRICWFERPRRMRNPRLERKRSSNWMPYCGRWSQVWLPALPESLQVAVARTEQRRVFTAKEGGDDLFERSDPFSALPHSLLRTNSRARNPAYYCRRFPKQSLMNGHDVQGFWRKRIPIGGRNRRDLIGGTVSFDLLTRATNSYL
jgi:hypothetical protein